MYQLMIGQVLFGFKSFAAILAGKSCWCRMSLEMTTQKPFNEEALAAMQTRIIVRGGFLMVLQCLQIWKRWFASRAAVIFLRGLLLLDGVDILMATKIRQGTEYFTTHMTPVFWALVTACVLQELLQIREHHAAAALHALVHFQR